MRHLFTKKFRLNFEKELRRDGIYFNAIFEISSNSVKLNLSTTFKGLKY